MYPSFCGHSSNISNVEDTILRLDGNGYETQEVATFGTGITNGRFRVMGAKTADEKCKLVLGLGPTPSACSDDHSHSFGDKTDRAAPLFTSCNSILKLGLSWSAEAASKFFDNTPADGAWPAIPVVDEGSTSAKKSGGGYMMNLVMAPGMENATLLLSGNEFPEPNATSQGQLSNLASKPSAVSSYSMSGISELGTAAVSSDLQGRNARRCRFSGCAKGARGGTALCIGHGGGQRCQKPGCNKGAESRTVYCRAHGGGRRCHQLGCTKSADGNIDHCIAHGGGKRCGYGGGCTKAARGKSGLCIKHGGGKRCKVEGCTRSAEGQIGLCISHGGGRRCHSPGCNKGAQGSTVFCKAHGGGKRCIFAGCTKGAEGSTPLCKGHGGGKRCMFDGGGICPKSVHGATDFCVAHGGGKRCSVPGCTKSARGRTDCCVKHGGGKRCQFENCSKSAQGSTNFCKAHGGGKRCSWAEAKCEKFARGKSGMCAAHCSLMQNMEAKRVGMIGPGLFHGLVSSASTSKISLDDTCSASGLSLVSELINSFEKPAKRQKLIPPQVLVPLSMKTSLSCSRPSGSQKQLEKTFDMDDATKSSDFVNPEGRVHGGGFLSFLEGEPNAITSSTHSSLL